MRTGLSTIQQTLTPEAATVLNHSIAEAARRNHGQTTPLHVAATLLASPTGFLRQACIRSHPNSSHPLQCRALELCFSVALDRLPSAATPANPSGGGVVRDPPISNALMAALKRAQAHQRRGCPEQQQQPLLAVKVELEQLVVSILDDPSVSRVMREASFSSPAVKAAVEQAMTSTSSSSSSTIAAPTASTAVAAASPSPKPSLSNSPPLAMAATRLGSLGPPRPTPIPLLPGNRNLYLNPRLQQQQQPPPQQQQQPQQSAPQMGSALLSAPQPVREEEVKKVLDILRKDTKRNPVLVGDSEPEALMREVLRRIEKREFREGDPLAQVQVLSLGQEFAADRSQIPRKLEKVGDSIESRGGDVLLDLGDLKWLVEAPKGSDPVQQRQPMVSEFGRVAVLEMRKLLQRFGATRRVWLMGTASCATYLRCQVYHPTMESDWDLQAVPIAARTPPPAMLLRNPNPQNGILSSCMNGSLAPPRRGPPTLSTPTISSAGSNSPLLKKTMCSICTENYEKELAKLVAAESNKSTDSKPGEEQPPLPRWLQAAKPGNGSSNGSAASDHLQELKWKENTQELAKKWSETCLRIHPTSNGSLLPQQYEPKVLPAQSFGPIRLSNFISKPMPTRAQAQPVSPPGSPVGTDLVLGQPKAAEPKVPEQNQIPRTDNSVDCMLDLFSKQDPRSVMHPESDSLKTLIKGLSAMNPESDSFKTLYKGLSEKVGWQLEAAAAVAVTMMRCKSGNGKRRSLGSRPDIWLLFLGPDKVGKKKMAEAVAELVYGNGSSPVTVSFSSTTRESGEDGESNMRFRGKTPIDRIAETIRRKPFSVFLLEDVDQADLLVRGTIKRAMDRGRLPDSHGREVSLGSAVFIMTAYSLPESFDATAVESLIQSEKNLEGVTNSNCGWRLELQVGEKTGKRRADWQCERRLVKPRKELEGGLSLDLNLGLASEDTLEGSRNSSDLTVEHDQIHEVGRVPTVNQPSPRLPSDFIDVVDDAIVFKAVDFVPLKKKISDALTARFNLIMGSNRVVKIDEDTLDWIVSGIWFHDAAADFEKWVESVLAPGFKRLNQNIQIVNDDVQELRLVAVKESSPATNSDHFPSRLAIVDDRGPLLLA